MSKENPFGLLTQAQIIDRFVYRFALESSCGMRVVYARRGVLRQLPGREVILPFGDGAFAGIRPLDVLFRELGMTGKVDPAPDSWLYIRENDQPKLLAHWKSQLVSVPA